MKIKKSKSSEYDSVNTDAICRYIKEYNEKIAAMLQDEERLENSNRTTLKQCAAELETVVKRLEYAMHGRY